MTYLTKLALPAALIALPSLGLAQEADVTPPNSEIGFIFTTFMFLIAGFLVFWMAAGFAMLEAGLVRGKNVTMQLTKNVALFGLAAIFSVATVWVPWFAFLSGYNWVIGALLGGVVYHMLARDHVTR